MSNLLNLANIEYNVGSLGPGNRIVVWVQGCPFKCKNCISPDWIPFKENNLISVETLAADILQNDFDGLTISGGEPTMQASGLAKLLEIVKRQKPETNIIVFTGFTTDQIKRRTELDEFLQHVDLLITGLYIDKLNDNKGLRGSSNQEFNYITNALLPFKNELENGERNIEITPREFSVSYVGIPNKGLHF